MTSEQQPPLCENYPHGYVLILWPSGKVQRFPSLAKAKTMLMRHHYPYIVCTPDEAMSVFELDGSESVDDWGEKWKLDPEHLYTSQTLWDYLTDISEERDPWTKSKDIPDSNRITKRKTAEGYNIHKDKCSGSIKLPKQARIIVEHLATADCDAMTEDAMVKFIRGLVLGGTLVTKQDPIRIFTYYRPKLIEAGYISLRS